MLAEQRLAQQLLGRLDRVGLALVGGQLVHQLEQDRHVRGPGGADGGHVAAFQAITAGQPCS